MATAELPGLTLVSRGKVRDIYATPDAPDALVFVASDRISAHDVVLRNVRPRRPLRRPA
jgi:phosphoribosylaminoimidazole-succinocarboxamide synthase